MRKFLFIFTLIFAASVSGMAQTQVAQTDNTFNFFHGSFDQALKDAGKQKKLIFVDAYTSWCGPCKMMSNTTFKDKTAGEFFTSRFVSMKIDMEKDAGGPEFARKYGVSAYPTLFFINAKGEVVHKILGYTDAVRLVEEAKKALALSK